ncbi:MAG: acylneuraminate cytidylyltransferase family protein [Deltaproteobacteria bacterium]|jgi:CMP-N-acetylneuraminic acid synthetase|nr:acylneuraminate cytidylyltransferase family protein [Deltaproteobacteria bacterium]
MLAVIPARGGSKGIKRKNIRPILGHPLLAWTITAAQSSKLIKQLIVSTDDKEIAAVASLYGARVLERPAKLATDEADTKSVLAHASLSLGNYFDEILLLQPTSPVRRPSLIDKVIEAFRAEEWDSMATGFLTLCYPPHGVEHRRQDIETVFVNDGSVIALKRSNLEKNSLFGQKRGTMVTSREENVDIDEEFDFWLAEKILEKGRAEGWLILPKLNSD